VDHKSNENIAERVGIPDINRSAEISDYNIGKKKRLKFSS